MALSTPNVRYMVKCQTMHLYHKERITDKASFAVLKSGIISLIIVFLSSTTHIGQLNIRRFI
ncbi:MAG: DUF645 family protein [Flavobacteriales bacterium]|nr:DUF645 family protein [Flavobacteriales bacterium]